MSGSGDGQALSVCVLRVLKTFSRNSSLRPNLLAERIWGSGLWRERFQTAVRFLGDRSVRKFFFELLVHAGGFLGIALAQSLGQFEKNKRTWNENRRVVGQVAENLGGIRGLSGALVNHSRLILRHGYELFVFAGTDLLQLFESLIVALEVFVAKRGVIGGEPAGIRVWIFFSNGGKFVNGIFSARGFRGIEGFAGIVGIG